MSFVSSRIYTALSKRDRPQEGKVRNFLQSRSAGEVGSESRSDRARPHKAESLGLCRRESCDIDKFNG
ncbi:hypothetical protein DY000_02025219 [Brassica cretica]|uniref:Uncharacterized protein n=1 Tax=Brassica cretica TaxID=69181 RepID=A0ABQ7E3U4_BRACR|nr:hypothetical protein DY000_02061692 [Brassica cretica]KAF3591225.1 hypothetical protein DY000_02025219 [Brassica cretica]